MIDEARVKKLEADLIRISNINNFIVDIPTLHPESPKYQKVWTEYTKYSVDGFWGIDFGKYRFMPPTLFFYGNFCVILQIDEQNKVREYLKPVVRDIDWAIHYAYIEAQGFSGFKNDDEFTCDYKALTLDLNKVTAKDMHMINSKGQIKKFINPRDYVRKLHDKPLGRPLYTNPARNLMIFGCRGGGKSYTVAGISTQTLTFDGSKAFTKKMIEEPPTATICIGAGNTEKSADLISKVKTCLSSFGTNNKAGVWGKPGDDMYTPNPFFRDWIGSLAPGNKAKNPFRYEYQIETPSGWQRQGTGTALYHVNYSDKKQGGAEAAAGGRYLLVVYEEVGLQSNFVDSLLSNVSTVTGDSEQFGVQIAIGTSGNIELVQQSKKVFHDPEDYNFLAFDDIWEDSGAIGLFIPAYLSDVKFKDENGNTNIMAALEKYYKRRKEAAEKKDPEILRLEKMSFPLVPSDMWLSSKGHHFPINELMDREKELFKNQLYKKLGRPVKMVWDSKQPYGVRADYDGDIEPFYEFPYSKSMSTIEGGVVIYEEPHFIKGEIPNDMYIFTYDPYVADNIEDGESLGVLKGFLNPRYTKDGYNGNMLVCTYIGKHSGGKDAYNEVVEKILAYYGNPNQGLWFEANRGDAVRSHFIKKKKLNLLALRPNKARGTSTHEKRVTEFGFMVSNKIDKLDMIEDTAEWLLSKTVYNGEEKRVVEIYPCIFTIRQLIAFTLDKYENYDAVSALIGFPLAIKELEHKFIDEVERKTKHNPMTFLSVNPRIFKNKPEHAEVPNKSTY